MIQNDNFQPWILGNSVCTHFCPKDSCGVSRGFRRQLRSVIFAGAKEQRSEFPNISQAHHGSWLSTWPYLWSRQFCCLMVGAAMPWHDVCGLSGKNFYGAPWLTQLGQILPICTVLIPKPAIWDPKINRSQTISELFVFVSPWMVCIQFLAELLERAR